MSNINWVNRTTGANTGTGLNWSVPAGLVPGDFMFMCFWLWTSTVTMSAPSGWSTALATDTVQTSYRQYMFQKVATGYGSTFSALGTAEPAVTFSWGTSIPYGGYGWALRGVDPINPYLVAPNNANNTTGSPIGNSMTPTSPGFAIWMYSAYRASSATTATVTPPADELVGAQIRTTAANGFIANTSGNTYSPQGVATGTRTATASPTGAWRSIAMVMRPAGLYGDQQLGMNMQHHDERSDAGLWVPGGTRRRLRTGRTVIDLSARRPLVLARSVREFERAA